MVVVVGWLIVPQSVTEARCLSSTHDPATTGGWAPGFHLPATTPPLSFPDGGHQKKKKKELRQTTLTFNFTKASKAATIRRHHPSTSPVNSTKASSSSPKPSSSTSKARTELERAAKERLLVDRENHKNAVGIPADQTRVELW